MNSWFKAVFAISLVFGCNATVAGPICQGEQKISQEFVNGTKWELCWEHKNKQGIVLKEIFFTTPDGLERKVLKEASLAQIHVAFDNGVRRDFHMENYGLGGNNMQDLASSQCDNGQLLMVGAKHAMCRRVKERGYVFKYYSEEKQGHLLDLYSQSNTGGYTWIIRWRFYDDGTIEPLIGATGALQTFGSDPNYGEETDESGLIAIASTINYFWRLDFDIAGNGANDIVEEFNVAPDGDGSKKIMTVSRLTTETGREINQQLKRSWRVRDGSVTNTDGHPISYHLDSVHVGYLYSGRSDEAWAQSDIYFTRKNACEQFVANNPSGGGCASDVTGYLNGQNIDGAEIVVWYGMTNHHIPRAEDQPYIPTRWDSFQLIPRDWTSTSTIAF